MFEELISHPKGPRLTLERCTEGGSVQLTFRLKSEPECVLHWGTARRESGPWQVPPDTLWPPGSNAHGDSAVQSPFEPESGGGRLTLRFPESSAPPYLVFDLFSPRTHRWENNRGKDFWIRVADAGPSPAAALEELDRSGTGSMQRQRIALDNTGELAVGIERSEEDVTVHLVTDVAGPLFLHWGIQERARGRWQSPKETQFPDKTEVFDDMAVRTPFEARDNLMWLHLRFARPETPMGIGFVLFQPDTGRWLKYRGSDLFLRLEESTTEGTQLTELMTAIVEGEMGPHGWTLMHRFNLCHDLMDHVADDRDAWVTLFVWLRYSAIRQLDWQRNYNTKPRELAHAQERLTAQLAEAHVHHPSQRDLIRLMLGCVGRGGEGQRIRDDILHIMHRHHIKEVGGTWMEQWHQKLHNNTTPDDIVICEAYLAFLRDNGNLAAYDETLLTGGVNRERLAGFERPITQNPEWHPHLKDALIHDFENYLALLKSVHSGTDLDTAANIGGQLLEEDARDALSFVQQSFREPQTSVGDLVRSITHVRRHLSELLQSETNNTRVKNGLYLDLALEEALRTVIERALHPGLDGELVFSLIRLVLDNLLLTDGDAELAQCARELSRLPTGNRFSPDWSLRAKAVADRLRRAVQAVTDHVYQLLQPKAEILGREFQADDWTVRLFSEAIVRGRSVFVLSLLLHHLDPILRRKARLGDWQVISPSRATGVVQWVDDLRALQGQRFGQATILVADQVHGDEEPPEGVTAVITARSVDLVSHVAVRARNARLLFATCFDPITFTRLKALEGRPIGLAVTSAGDVKVEEGGGMMETTTRHKPSSSADVEFPTPSLRVLRQDEFERGLVGGKSWHIRVLAERLSKTVKTPRSVALPFGAFDAVVAEKENVASARRIAALLQEIKESPTTKLADLRACIQGLQMPADLLREVSDGIQAAGLPRRTGSHLVATISQAELADAAMRIKQVWASLWNDRAYFSRETIGFPHDRASMAVLIQEVVPVQYAFVIHTVNPTTGNSGELYGEVVQGLGETLVGNYPGRALSFVADKTMLDPMVTAYPSKSVALRGGGLIFRSDSNAEDLEGYAGAGLYDSVLLKPTHEERTDYTGDALVWDPSFQTQILKGITELGISIEQEFGGAQDIEGTWSNGEFYVVQTRPQV